MVKLCWSQRARARHTDASNPSLFPFFVKFFVACQCAVREACILRFFFERALKQARLPVNMGGMGLTGAEDIRNAAWVGTWALVTRPIREKALRRSRRLDRARRVFRRAARGTDGARQQPRPYRIPMRDDMKMESWAMRVTVQRRLGLPLDVACQAAEAGKRAPSGRLHDVLGDAAMVI